MEKYVQKTRTIQPPVPGCPGRSLPACPGALRRRIPGLRKGTELYNPPETPEGNVAETDSSIPEDVSPQFEEEPENSTLIDAELKNKDGKLPSEEGEETAGDDLPEDATPENLKEPPQ